NRLPRPEIGGMDENGTQADCDDRESQGHFDLRSTPTFAGDPLVTVTVSRRSPSSGGREPTSWTPSATLIEPIGVFSTGMPSTNTSAHGTALMASVPLGQFGLIDAVWPAATCTVRRSR